MGALITQVDRALNRSEASPARARAFGVVSLIVVLLAAGIPAAVLQAVAGALPGGPIVLAVIASSLLAQRSLWSHVSAVADALEQGGLAAGRRAVAHIVGRDPEGLDEAGIVRAAAESLAENFSDGVVAPALWCALLGLPGIALYKAVNTADSMIGHRTPRHLHFGWAAARFDDLVNLPASRLSALWLILAATVHPGADARAALRAVRRDARRHRSPNAGWPEAAMAGALGLRLAGPRRYGGIVADYAWIGDGRAELGPADLRRALSLYRRACAVEITTAVILLAALLLA
jgi:adenosylcobinamide-phosphate synthase